MYLNTQPTHTLKGYTPEVLGVERLVSRQNAYERNIREIETLGYHLRAYHNVVLAF